MTTRQIQNLLDYLGYDPGVIDGANGPNTEDAVRAFQAAEGLTADGIPGPLTEAKLLDAVAAGRVYKPQETASKPPRQDWHLLGRDRVFHPGGIPVQVRREILQRFSGGNVRGHGTLCR